MPETETQETKPVKALQQSIKTVGTQPEVFYQSVVIQSLLGILADASLVSTHTDVIEVLLAIFKTQGMKCVPFLPQIIPAFTAMCRASNARHQDFYLQQMSIMIQIVGAHIRNYVDEVFQLTKDLWANKDLRLPIVGLVESLATAMAAEFKKYLPVVIPKFLTIFDEPGSPAEVKVFHTMLSFGSAVEEYIHLILPVLLATVERTSSSKESRKAAVTTIGGLARRVSLVDNASRIVHPLVRTLISADTQLKNAIMDTLCVLLQQLGADFAIFIPGIQAVRLHH
jgi:FKBP12-rapamycin complex-associated protein